MGWDLIIPHVKYDNIEEMLKALNYFTSIKTTCLTYFMAVHSLEALENKVLQGSHWILGKTMISHVHSITAYSRKMLLLPHTYLATLWTLAWVTLGWWAYRILTWSPEEGWKRHRMERSDTPQSPECPLLQFQEVISSLYMEVYG